MYEHVIIPFDGSEAARRAVVFGADLTKVFSAHALVVTTSVMDDPAIVAEFKTRAVAMSDERVDVWFESAPRTADGIAAAVAHRPDSLVCVATHARSGMSRLTKGSITEAVLARVDCPLVLLGPNHQGMDPVDIRRLVICIDGSETADSILPLAGSWARDLHLACTLVHVAGGERAPDLGLAADLLEPVSPNVESVVIAGPEPTAGILELLESSPPAFVVMGAHGRTGWDRLRSGSRIMEVVRETTLPVLVQRADAVR